MKNYETIFIMKTDITQEQTNDVISKVEKYIKENGTITKTINYGKKKLAYEIKKQEYGYYYLIEFTAEPEIIPELERIYRITVEILKFMTIRKD